MRRFLAALITAVFFAALFPADALAQTDLPYDKDTVISVLPLSSRQKSFLATLYAAASTCQAEVSIPAGLTSEDVFEVLDALVQDYPEIFHVVYEDCTLWTYGSTPSTMDLGYSMSASAYSQTRQKLLNTARQLIRRDSSAEGLHQLLLEQVAYDYTFREDSYTAVSALLQGRAVCDGYADALTLLYRMAGIPCGTIHGTANNGSGTGWQPHAWNIADLGGFTLIDPTWNDMDMNLGAGMYFGLSTAQMAEDHRPDSSQQIPACNAYWNSFRSQTPTVSTVQEVYEVLNRMYRTGEPQTVIAATQQLYDTIFGDLQGFMDAYRRVCPSEFRYKGIQVSSIPSNRTLIFSPYSN